MVKCNEGINGDEWIRSNVDVNEFVVVNVKEDDRGDDVLKNMCGNRLGR
jgi:hypothetical protein